MLVVFNTNLSSCFNGTDSGASSVDPGSGTVPALGMPLSTGVLGVWGRMGTPLRGPVSSSLAVVWLLVVFFNSTLYPAEEGAAVPSAPMPSDAGAVALS